MLKIIDPNNKIIYTNINGNLNSKPTIQGYDYYDTNPFGQEYHRVNAAPQLEKMFKYVSLKVRNNHPASITRNNQAGNDVIELLGYNQQKGSGFENSFTTKYTEDGHGNSSIELNEENWEGFGIKNIEIDTGLGFITGAKITLIDTRFGSSLGEYPYNILFAVTPNPQYELTVKGYYGKAIRYFMTLENVPKISVDSTSGAYLVTINLRSISWKALSSVSMGEIMALPFLSDAVLKAAGDLTGSLANGITFDNSQPPRSFYEFYKRSDRLYSDLTLAKVGTDFDSRETELNRINTIIDKIEYIGIELGKLVNTEVSREVIVNGKPITKIIGARQNVISLTRRFTATEQIYLLSNNDPKNQQIIIDVFNDRLRRINANDIINKSVIGFDDANDVFLFTTNSTGEPLLILDVFFDLTKAYRSSIIDEFKALRDEKTQLVETTITNTFGFKPTISNIIELICNDVDTFFNLLYDTGQEAINSGRLNPASSGLLDTGFGGIDSQIEFPSFIHHSVDSKGISRLEEKSPTSDPSKYFLFPEYKIVDEFYKAITKNTVVDALIKQNNNLSVIDGNLIDANYSDRVNNIEEVKDQIYYSLKDVYDVWLRNWRQPSPNKYSYPNNGDNGTTDPKQDGRLFNKFYFVDRAMNDISDTIINIFKYTSKDFSKYTVYQFITTILEENSFKVMPFESFILNQSNGLSQDTFIDSFEPLDSLDEFLSTPAFICMYNNNDSRQIRSYDKTIRTDSFNMSDSSQIPPDFNAPPNAIQTKITGDVFAFKVGFGESNQSYFTNVKLGIDDGIKTYESYNMIDEITSTRGGNRTVTVGQNMYDVYSKLSFKASVTMIGCMSIQPTQYFVIEHNPVFSGTYMITNVKHSIDSGNNDHITTFEGFRISRYTKPITSDNYYRSLSSLLDDLPNTLRSTVPIINDAPITRTTTVGWVRSANYELVDDFWLVSNSKININTSLEILDFIDLSKANMFDFNSPKRETKQTFTFS